MFKLRVFANTLRRSLEFSASNSECVQLRVPFHSYPRTTMHYSPHPNDESTKTSELLTDKELAKRLRVSERKIELDTKLPLIRWGRTVRYDWNEVLRFLKTKSTENL